VYSIIEVPDDAAELTEQLGTKPKFWFRIGNAEHLFKEARPGSGEDWSEKDRISATAGDFALAILDHNRNRLLSTREVLAP